MAACALVIGAAGQDGSYISEQLRSAGVDVVGLTRQGLVDPRRPQTVPVSIDDADAMRDLIADGGFSEIYYLAAYHHSSEDEFSGQPDLARRSFAVHVNGLLNVLDAMVACKSKASVVYAASSHVFGVVADAPQTEETPLVPICAYGASKASGIHLCRLYRADRGVRVGAAILFNHESPRRPVRFLSRKVARAVVDIERGRRRSVSLGNLSQSVDWGYAPEYTDAMRRMAALEQAGDFVVSSGRAVRLDEYVAAAFEAADLDWKQHVTTDLSLQQKVRRGPLVGNASKLARMTGWSAVTTVPELARLMVDAERKSPEA